MALGADDVKAALADDAVAKEDVDAAAGHVRRKRDRAGLPGLLDDQRFALVVLRVQDLVLDAVPAEPSRELLALLDARGADEDRLSLVVALLDLLDDRVPFALLGPVDQIWQVPSDHRLVRRDLGDLELVDLEQLLRLGRGGTGHPGELVVHPEVVLDRDRRVGTGLALDLQALLRLDGLVQPVAPAAPRHEPSGELVDDDHLAVLDDVLLVLVIKGPRLHRVVEVMDGGDVPLVHVLYAEQLLRAPDAVLGEHDGVLLLLDDVVGLRLKLRGDARERVVGLAGVLGRRADDEGGAGLIDEDRVGLVDDRVVQAAPLHLVVQVHGHVVAEVVEAEFAVLPVRDVGLVRLAARDVAPVPVPGIDRLDLHRRVVDRALFMCDVGNRRSERVVDRRHPSRAGLREVVVRRDEVRPLAFERVGVEGQRGDEGLALTGPHLGDMALVQSETAHELHVEMSLPEGPLRGLADRGEDLGEDVVERFAFRQALAKACRALGELLVAPLLELRLELVDARGDLAELAKLAFVGVEQPADEAHGTAASCDR